MKALGRRASIFSLPDEISKDLVQSPAAGICFDSSVYAAACHFGKLGVGTNTYCKDNKVEVNSLTVGKLGGMSLKVLCTGAEDKSYTLGLDVSLHDIGSLVVEN